MFELTDPEAVLRFMAAHSLATIITAPNGTPNASHLPFCCIAGEEEWILYSHFAIDNTQWMEVEQRPVLVVFGGADAYISPRHYSHTQNVPTWNYAAVHIYGDAVVIQDNDGATDVLEKMIDAFEPEYMDQWNALDAGYKNRLLPGIKAIKVLVTDVKAVRKLSQNKNRTEQRRIEDALGESARAADREVAQLMCELYGSGAGKPALPQ